MQSGRHGRSVYALKNTRNKAASLLSTGLQRTGLTGLQRQISAKFVVTTQALLDLNQYFIAP